MTNSLKIFLIIFVSISLVGCTKKPSDDKIETDVKNYFEKKSYNENQLTVTDIKIVEKKVVQDNIFVGCYVVYKRVSWNPYSKPNRWETSYDKYEMGLRYYTFGDEWRFNITKEQLLTQNSKSEIKL